MLAWNENLDAKDNMTPQRVAFELKPAMADELDRVSNVTGLHSRPEIFRRAFTLLRIHIDAAMRGHQIYMVDPDKPDEKYIVTLPFTCKIDQSREPGSEG